MSNYSSLSPALAASLFVHLAVILAIPSPRFDLPAETETIIEVAVAEPEPKRAEAVRPPPPEPLKELESMPKLSAEEDSALSDALASAIFATAPPPAAAPAITLPTRKVGLPEPDAISWSAPQAVALDPLPGIPAPPSKNPPGPDMRAVKSLADSLLRDLAGAKISDKPGFVKKLRDIEIEWEDGGAAREIVHLPSPPKVQSRNQTDVRVKFWISPQGIVLRALPIQRGEPEQEKAALTYIKAFKFSELPPGQDREQWGTLNVKFRVE